jgi:replicative DNA helicase
LHGFGPKGSVVLLHAHGGCGKTRLVYDWIWSLVNGEPWQGFQVTAQRRRVLIVQTDESQGDMLSTLDHRGFTSDMPIMVKTRWTADHMASLRRDVESFKPDVILIDSLTSINQNSLFSENDTEYARPILELRDLAQEFGSLIYLVHHSNSEGNSRGTKAITASVSHVFKLSFPADQSDPRSPTRHLTIQKSRARAPEKYELEFNPETGGWTLLGVCEDREDKFTTEGPLRKQIMDILSANRNVPLTSQEITSITGHNANTVRKTLSDLGSHGEISRKKNGKHYCYWLADDDADKSLLSFESVPCDNSITVCNDSSEMPADQSQISSGSVVDQSRISSGSVVENSQTLYTEAVSEPTCGKLFDDGSVSHDFADGKKSENFSDPSDQLPQKQPLNAHPVSNASTDPLTDPSTDHQLITSDHIDQQPNPVPSNSPISKTTVDDFNRGDVVRIIQDPIWGTVNHTGWVSYVYPEQIEVTYYEPRPDKQTKRLYYPDWLEIIE